MLRQPFALLVVCVLISPAQTPPPARSRSAATKSAPAPASGIDAIIALINAKVSEPLILKTIRAEGKAYKLAPADLLKLQQAGASETIIQTLMDPTSTPEPPATATAPQAAAPIPAPNATSQPAVAVPTATPAPSQVAVAQAAPAADAPGAKKPGIKRIGLVTLGTQGDAVRGDLQALLQGDGSILEVVLLTQRIEAYRQIEAQKKECDLVLETTFEAKKAAGAIHSRRPWTPRRQLTARPDHSKTRRPGSIKRTGKLIRQGVWRAFSLRRLKTKFE